MQVQTGSSTGRNEGYKYFGAAKLLPGVRELFEKEPPRKVRRTKHQMHQKINADYYGFRDDEDGILEREEAKAEKVMRAEVGPGEGRLKVTAYFRDCHAGRDGWGSYMFQGGRPAWQVWNQQEPWEVTGVVGGNHEYTGWVGGLPTEA